MKIDTNKLHMMQVDEAIEKFTVGEDYILDRALVEADCFGSAGHAAGLRKIGFLSEADHASLAEGLREIVETSRKGEFEIRREQEDCHTAIETHLTATKGDVGKRIHAGRSRNDQVVCAMRLWSKWEMLILARELRDVPELLIAVYPTRGLDVGAIEYVRKVVVACRDSGSAILLISEDLDELLALSDRIAVIYEGRLTFMPTKDVGEIGLAMAGSYRRRET